MTIKQQGGIFGRNPTFNDVTSASATTNDLTVNANGTGIIISGNNTSAGSKNNLRFVDTDASVASGQQVGRIEFYTSDAGNEGINAYIEGRDGSSSGSGSIVLGTGNSGAAVDRLELVSGGNLNLLTGNLVISTSGKGIDFSATSGTGTSELFDDYEEGTWTPTIIGGTTAGSGTYSQQDGVYTKVGNLVTVSCYLAFTAHTGTGHMKISGLPFAGVGSSVDFQAGATQAQYVNAGTGATQLCASVVTTASDISLYGFVNNAVKVATQVNASGSGSQLAITLTYRTT